MKKKNIDEVCGKVAIVSTEWNRPIVLEMQRSAIKTLVAEGMTATNINCYVVPGAWELPGCSAKLALEQTCGSIIALGCVIRGQTPHFEYISSSVSHGLQQVAVNYTIPVIFGVLTTDNRTQATERAEVGGKNKGKEFALSLIKLATTYSKL